MIKLLFVFCFAMLFSWLSDKYETRNISDWDYDKRIKLDWFFIAVIVLLVLFAGLRRDYNDTAAYIRNFSSDTGNFDTFKNSNEAKLLKNPAFNLYSWGLRRITTNSTIFILIPSAFTEFSIVRFLKKYSVRFTFSIYLLFTLGMFCFTLGAMKQSIAIGILTYAIEAADKKKYIKFALLVGLAFLFHTYAIVLIITPFLRAKPWSWFTWLIVVAAIVAFNNLESILGSIVDAAAEGGKKIYTEEILGGKGSNTLRIAVYAVPPLLSFIFRKNLFEDSKPIENIFVHLSVLSFACMAYGLTVNANEADRLATYYEIGTVISLPWMLNKALNKKQFQFISIAAYLLFFAFFYYKFGMKGNFDMNFRSSLPFIDMLG